MEPGRQIRKYLKALILLLFVAVVTGCEDMDEWKELQQSMGDFFSSDKKSDDDFVRYGQVEMSNAPVIEYIVDPKDKQSRFVSAEIQKACDYTKIPFHATSVRSWSAHPRILSTVRTIVVFDTKKLSNTAIAKLTDFVATGGTLFIPFASEDHRMGFLYGYKPDADFDTDAKSAGWYFSTPLLPTLKGKTTIPNLVHYGFARKNFGNDIKVFATAANNPYYPLILEHPVGKGKVLLYNTTGIYIKQDRGLLFAGVLKGLEAIPYPIANTSTVFLDDFPSPLYDIKAEPVASELHLMMSDYVKQVWWPDMQKLAKEFNIKYSAMIAFDYKNKVYPPFVFDQWNAKKIKLKNKVEPMSDWLVRDVARTGHELSLHGYNHVELTPLWTNREFIPTAFKAVQKKWDASNFGPMPVTYVPPSNIIDARGTQDLKKGMPSIKYMCSLFLGETKEGGNREFDYEPFNRELFDYPRTASGFYMTDEEEYVLQSIYLFTGIWNHFVHPDDIFQIPSPENKSAGQFDLRNRLGYGWYKSKNSDKAMFPEFRRYLRMMNNTFPQLRFMSAGEGAKATIDWRASRYTHRTDKGLYTVSETGNSEETKKYWFMYGSVENGPRIEAQLKRQASLYSKTPMMDGYLYSAYTTKPALTSIDLKYKTPEQRRQMARIVNLVRADYFQYLTDVKKFLSGEMDIEKEKQKAAADLAALKLKILSQTEIDSVSWNKYAKLMSWEDKGDEIWKMLDTHVKKYPSAHNVMYSKELDRVIGYPNDIVREKWLSAQLEINPDDKGLLKIYIADFNTEENRLKIKNAMKALLKVENTPENFKSYIGHLLQYYPDEALAELNKLQPSGDFGELTSSIIWLYADNKDIRKAYEWSKFSKDVDFDTKMSWLIELKDYAELEKAYNKYIAENPIDFKAKATWASVLHDLGRFRESWVLANSLPESPEKEELRKMLNIDVVFEPDALQMDLVANEPELFYPNVMASIIKQDRLEHGNFVDTDSRLETNQKNPAIFKNRISYNFYDKKQNIHSIGAVYSTYYEQHINENYSDNYDNSVKGLEYKFTKAERENKINYFGRIRAGLDEGSKAHYELGIGANRGINRKFTSAEFNIFPAETGPALNQGIYQMKLNLYHERYLFKKINASLAIEGSYYTEGLLRIDTVFVENPGNPEEERHDFRKVYVPISDNGYTVTTFDEAIEGAATLHLAWDDGEERRSRFVPYVEAQYSRGSLDQAVGYPYWMIMQRVYGGGGLGWNFSGKSFHSKVDAGYFFDDYSGNFQRYMGNVQWQLFEYTAVTANFEFFSQDKYYSNSIQFGIKYNFKKKIKRKK